MTSGRLPGLDLPAVTGWLRANGVPLGEDVTATLFPGGRSNVTYRLEDADGRCVVVRRPPLGNVLPSAHDMAREHRVLSGLHAAGFPVPRPLALCTDEAVNGCVFQVMALVPGEIVATRAQADGLGTTRAHGVCRSLVDTLADLHRLDPADAGLSDLGRPAGYLPRQLDRWTRQWGLTRTRDLPEMDALRDRIEAMIAPLPVNLPSAIVHGDYRLDNVILDDRDAVVAVLDWEMSTLGDPLADLALALVYWTQADDVRRHLVPVAEHLTDGAGFWDRSAIIDAYAARTGLAMDHLDACTALACYKLAVITESIHARALSGKQLGTAAGDLESMGIATQALADLGLAVVAHGTVDGLRS